MEQIGVRISDRCPVTYQVRVSGGNVLVDAEHGYAGERGRVGVRVSVLWRSTLWVAAGLVEGTKDDGTDVIGRIGAANEKDNHDVDTENQYQSNVRVP